MAYDVEVHNQRVNNTSAEVERAREGLYLVGQEAVGDIAMRIDGRRHDRAVGDAHTVVHFIPFLHCRSGRDNNSTKG